MLRAREFVTEPGSSQNSGTGFLVKAVLGPKGTQHRATTLNNYWIFVESFFRIGSGGLDSRRLISPLICCTASLLLRIDLTVIAKREASVVSLNLN